MLQLKKIMAVATLTAVAAISGPALLAGPAAADADSGPTSGTTTTTFTINGGSLSITTPASASLGTTYTPSSPLVSGSLGTVTVTDQRATAAGSWTASVVSSAFTSGSNTIAASNVGYVPGVATTTGTGVFAPGVTGLTNISTSQTAYTAATEVGATTCAWNPTINVTLAATGVVAGSYSGTITHSVA